MKDKYELLEEQEKLQEKKRNLERRYDEPSETIYAKMGGEISSYTDKPSYSEIIGVSKELSEVQHELNKMSKESEQKTQKYAEAYKEVRETAEKESSYEVVRARQKEARANQEEERKTYFNMIRQNYKGYSKWDRFKNVINGKKPKWKSIEKYTIEELSFIQQVAAGNTHFQRKRDGEIESRNSYDEARKKISKKHWNDLTSALSASKVSLQTKMQAEETIERGGARYGR